jgi:aryl-alcohol dehydrogenase-like predicted oxidoreductase
MMTMTRGEAADVMKELEREECIEAWGVAAATKEVARAAIVAGAKVVCVPYNAFMSRDLHDLAGDLSIAGTGVLARSVLSYGLLAGHFTSSRGFPASDHRSSRWTRDELKTRIDQLEALRPLVTGDVLSLRAVALRFVLVNQLVSSAVLGPRSMPQLEQLVREAGNAPPYLPEEGLSRLPGLLEKAGVVT